MSAALKSLAEKKDEFSCELDVTKHPLRYFCSQVEYKGQPTAFTPEHICGQIFLSLKATAEVPAPRSIAIGAARCPCCS